MRNHIKLLRTKLTQREWLIITIIILTILGIFVYRSSKNNGNGSQAVPVLIAPAIKKDITVHLHANGNVVANTSVAVKSQVTGVITQVNFKEGQFVRANDLLFVIDPRPYQVSLLQAEANLARDQATLNYNQVDVARNAKLLKNKYISEDQYQQLLSQMQAQQATVKADEAAVANAKLQLEYCYIRSPIDGRTGERQVDLGNLIASANTQTMVVVNQIAPITVSFSIPEQYLHPIQKSFAQGPIQVIATSPKDSSFYEAGQLTLIDNTIDNTTGTFLLKASFTNQDHAMWPGQFLDIQIPLYHLTNAIVVPAQAIQQGQDGTYVYVLAGNKTVNYRPVTTGSSVDNETVVLSNLQIGEQVVTMGQFQLKDGAKVTVQQAAADAQKQKKS